MAVKSAILGMLVGSDFVTASIDSWVVAESGCAFDVEGSAGADSSSPKPNNDKALSNQLSSAAFATGLTRNKIDKMIKYLDIEKFS
jgi:hypothetical protein